MDERFIENIKVQCRKNKLVYCILKVLYTPIALYLKLRLNYITSKKTDILYAKLKQITAGKSRLYYFGVPIHENLGDAAQMSCIRRWIKENYPEREVIEIETLPTYRKKIRKCLETIITHDDVIINQSGATFCNRHEDHGMHRYLLKTFKQTQIIFMPQTVDLTDKGEMKITASLFNSHPLAFFLARDPESYRMVKEAFDNNRIMLCPDIVTTLIGNTHLSQKSDRKGILICKRIDGEKKYSDANISKLLSDLRNIADVIDMTDTNFDHTIEYTYSHLDMILRDKFSMLAKYDVILTDRYHGMIFSLIANTPVVVLPTTGHKVREGALWFKKDYPHSIEFSETPEEAFNIITRMIKDKVRVDNISLYKEQYYDSLKEQINSKIKK